jgi:hypothetical protein
MNKIPIVRHPPMPLTPMETLFIKRIEKLISEYRERREDSDRTERVIYSCIVSDLEQLLAEIAHS